LGVEVCVTIGLIAHLLGTAVKAASTWHPDLEILIAAEKISPSINVWAAERTVILTARLRARADKINIMLCTPRTERQSKGKWANQFSELLGQEKEGNG
jgi:hypothetical protein